MANGVTKANTQSVNQRKRDEEEEARRQSQARKRQEEEMKRQQAEMKRQQEEAARQQEAERKRQAESSRKNSERRNQTSSKVTPDASIPVLEPKYASAEAIQRGREVGRRARAAVDAGEIQSDDFFTRGLPGMAEVYHEMAKQKEAQAQAEAEARQQWESYRDRMLAENASRNAQRRADSIPEVEPTSMQEEANPATPQNNYAENYNLSDSDRKRLEAIDADIQRLSGHHQNYIDDRRIRGLQAEKEKMLGQTLSQGRDDQESVIDKWVDNDYKMTDSEIEQAKQIIKDFDATEYKNSNIYDLTDEEQKRLSMINALRDKVSKADSATYGVMNATPGIDAMMTAADNEFYGWTLNDLQNEVAMQRDIPLSADAKQAVDQLKSEINDLKASRNNAVYSTGDAAIDEIIGANTSFRNTAEVDRQIEEKQKQIYKLMLMAARGDEGPNYDSYSFRKANAQKQNPLEYTAGDMATRIAYTAGIQNGLGSNGLAADLFTDAVTDTIPEYLSNKANGMSDVEAGNRAFGSALLNSGIDVGVWGAQHADEIIPELLSRNVARQADEVPTLDPLELAKQNEADMPRINAEREQAEEEIRRLADEIPENDRLTDEEVAELKRRQTYDEWQEEPEAAKPTETPAEKALNKPQEKYASLSEADKRNVRAAIRNSDLGQRTLPGVEIQDKVAQKQYWNEAIAEAQRIPGELYEPGTPEYYYALDLVSDRMKTLEDAQSQALSAMSDSELPWFNPNAKADLGAIESRIKDRFSRFDVSGNEELSQLKNDINDAVNDLYDALDGTDAAAVTEANKRLQSLVRKFDYRAKKVFENYKSINGKDITRPAWRFEQENAPKEPELDLYELLEGKKASPAEEVPTVEEAVEQGARQADEIPTMEAESVIPPGNEPPIPPKNEIPTPEEPKNPLGYDPNDPYVKDPNAMNAQQIDEGGTRQSKVGTNTMRSLDSDEQYANDLSNGIYQYTPKTEQGTMRVGAQRVAESPNKAYNDILSTPDNAFTAEDVDTSMMLRNKIKQDLAAAKEAGDEQATNYLQSQLEALTIRQRKAATNAGQVSQAWAKWSRDADGAVFASYNIAARQYEDALKNNPKLGETMHSIAEEIGDDIHRLTSEELWEELANADLSGESVDKLSDHIQDMIKSVLEKQGNYRIKKNLQDANIKKVSDTLAMQLRQGEDIGETLDMIEQAGVTGFTGIDDSIEQEVRELFDEAEKFGFKSKQRWELENQAYARLAEALNLTGGIYDKVDTIRYFAMLANPKTHLRNIAGNWTWGEITNFKDQLAGILEDAVDKASLKKGARAAENGKELKHGGQGIDRTTTFIRKNGADRNLYNASKDDFFENAYADLVGDKYTTAAQGIEGNKNVFGYGKVGSAASDTVKANSKLLEAEDVAAKQRKYADSLTRYLKANGYDESILKGDITDKATLDFLDEARAYAIKQAQEATFNQENVVADSLSKFSREARNIDWSDATAGAKGKKLAGLFLDATVPFKRTPLNIVTSLWDYQPIHLARFGIDIADVAKHKPKAVNKLIDDLAKETTGIGLLGAGYGLAKSGFIHGRKDAETGELDDLTGKQDYSLDLGPLGTYSLDWLSPSLTIMLAGANLAQSGVTSEGLQQMLADIGEPVLETTMLSSLVDVLRSAQYADSPMETVKQTVATAAKNYATQFVPTELGNIARTVDNTRRSTYTDKTGVAGIFDRTLKSVENRLPGLSKLNQPYINRWGHEEQNLKGAAGDNALARFGYQHFSPGYYSANETTPKDEYLYNLYEQFPSEDIMPPAFATSITDNGVKRKVTPEEKTTKDKAEGQAREDLITAISESDAVKALDPETQAKIVKDAYDTAKLVGNASIIDGYTSTDKAYNTYTGENGGADAFIKHELAKYNLGEAGVATNSKAGEAVTNLYAEGNTEAAEKLTQDITTLSNAGVSTVGQGTYSDRGITYLGDFSAEEYADLWNKININNTADNPNDKIAQGELIDYFNANPTAIPDQETAMRYWLGMLSDYDDSKKVPYYDTSAKEWKTHARTDDESKLITTLSGEQLPVEQTSLAQQTNTNNMSKPNMEVAEQQPVNAQQILQQSAPQTMSTSASSEIPQVTGDYTPGDTKTALKAIQDSGLAIEAPDAYWRQAYKANPNITPDEFVNLWYAIDTALGQQANGGLSKAEWVQYLNNNDRDYAGDMEVIDMLYNTRNKKLKYNNGTWRQ